MSTLCSIVLHSYQISIEYSTCGMWRNEEITSWNCVMLPCHYGPKSLRNVSSNLLNLCHEELRQL